MDSQPDLEEDVGGCCGQNRKEKDHFPAMICNRASDKKKKNEICRDEAKDRKQHPVGRKGECCGNNPSEGSSGWENCLF